MRLRQLVRWAGGLLLATGLMAGGSGSAIAQTGPRAPSACVLPCLYDQTATQSVSGWTSSTHWSEPSLANFASQAADDFINNSNSFWHITRVTISGLYDVSGSSTVSSLLLQFYLDAGTSPARPGALLRPSDTIPAAQIGGLASGLFVITLTAPLTVGPAHFWLSAQANKAYTSSDTGRQWAWRESTAMFFNESVWQNPGNGYAKNCPTWLPRVTVCHEPTTNSQGNDLVFKLEGTTTPVAAQIFMPVVRR